MALTADTLCPLLASGLQWSVADVGAYLAALRGRGLLQSGDAPLRTENAGLAILALLSGFPPGEAVGEALRLAAFCSAGSSTQRTATGSASVVCNHAPGAMLEVPADMLGWMLGACFAGMFAVAAGALGLYVIARAEGRGIFTVGPPYPTAALPKASGAFPNGL